ncbi:MAG: permease-like cell division protein FtsX [Clostridia bacterium]|nr:permease-like cell division protein FtsX [Clostridia bacterium]
MRFFRSLGRHISQGFKSIHRNKVMTTVSIIILVSCMLILGTFYLVITNIEENFNSIDHLNIIEVRIRNTCTPEEVEKIGESLTAICRNSPIITEDPVYVSSEEHLKRFHELYNDQTWSTFFTGELNPLRASYQITFTNFSDITEVVSIVSKIEDIELDGGSKAISAGDISSCIDVYRNVMSIKRTLYTVGIALMVILILFSLFVIGNTIKLGITARKDEIMFMRYCGATKHFIRAPFIVEGIIIGLLSALIALGLECLLYVYALSGIVRSSSVAITGGEIAISPFSAHLPILAAAFVIMGLFAGIIACAVSLKKYLKV